MSAPVLNIYQSSSHDPIVLFTYPHSISMFNLIHLQPRMPPLFPFDQMDLVESTQRMHVTGGPSTEINPETSMWTIPTVANDAQQQSDTLMACAMGRGGTLIIGVGAKGSLWVWKA